MYNYSHLLTQATALRGCILQAGRAGNFALPSDHPSPSLFATLDYFHGTFLQGAALLQGGAALLHGSAATLCGWLRVFLGLA